MILSNLCAKTDKPVGRIDLNSNLNTKTAGFHIETEIVLIGINILEMLFLRSQLKIIFSGNQKIDTRGSMK
jgi:hypothetical protein